VLELTNIHRAYRGRPILEDVSLSLPAGRIAWLGGSNGAGKTTLLRVASGLVTTDQGNVSLEGLHPVRDRRAYQRRLGFLTAGNGALYARLTIAQHLRFWADIAFIPPADRDTAITRVVADLNLDEILSSRVDRMSMGQRQRARLAMAVLHEPDLLLLDEPHTSLDEPGIELLAAFLRRHADRGGAALWCSPSLSHANLPADDAYEIRERRLYASATAAA
jgi:ABC-2 type transport system ATP-binding protein